MIILGIDPGTATTGFGVIRFQEGELLMLDYGCIITLKHQSLATRLQQLTQDLDEIISHWKPDHVAVEELFFQKNVKTAMHVAHARGAMMQKICEKGYQLHEYKPQQIKEAVCGYGRADKQQVQRMVQIILKMDHLPKPDDAADALGVAICHANTIKLQSLINRYEQSQHIFENKKNSIVL